MHHSTYKHTIEYLDETVVSKSAPQVKCDVMSWRCRISQPDLQQLKHTECMAAL